MAIRCQHNAAQLVMRLCCRGSARAGRALRGRGRALVPTRGARRLDDGETVANKPLDAALLMA